MPSPPQKRILLLGGGELGTSFLHALSTLPSPSHNLTLAIRSPAKYSSLTTTYPSLSLLKLNLSAPSSSLIPTFASYDIIISATGFMQTPSTLLKLCDEILEAGRLRQSKLQASSSNENGNSGKDDEDRLWFFPWQWGVDYDITGDGEGLMPLFGAQKSVRDKLRADASNHHVNWTVVSTGIFMSFLFEESWGIVDTSTSTSTSTSKEEEEEGRVAKGKITIKALRNRHHKVTVTHVNDIGRVLARIISNDIDAKDKVVYVAGQTVSYGELADIVEKVTGKEVEREELSIEYLAEELSKDPEDWLKKYRLVFARDGVWWDEEGTVNRRLGMSMVGVEEYARKVLAR